MSNIVIVYIYNNSLNFIRTRNTDMKDRSHITATSFADFRRCRTIGHNYDLPSLHIQNRYP